MTTQRAVRTVVVGALLSFGWACAPPLREEILGRGQPASFLECQPLTVPADTQRVGPAGRALQSGRNRLEIPPNAVSQETVFTFETARGRRVRVDVTPSTALAQPARLIIDLSHCPDGAVTDALQIWRFRDQGGTGEQLRTRRNGNTVWTIISHSSHYMIVN